MNNKNLVLILAPFLIILFPVLSLFSRNTCEILLGEVMLFMLPIMLITILLVIFFTYIYKKRSKGTFFTCYLLLFFFYFHHLLEAFNNFTQDKWGTIFIRLRYIILFFIVFSVYLFYKILNTKKISPFLFSVIIIIFGSLNSFIIAKIIKNYYVSYFLEKEAIKQNKIFLEKLIVTQKLGDSKDLSRRNLPDIYYIIPDMYTSQKILSKYYDYDLSWFSGALKNNEFFIAEESHCNYPRTDLSVCSSLNMRYISENSSPPTIKSLIKNNIVFQFLHQHGYKIINIRSSSGVTGQLDYPPQKSFLSLLKKLWTKIIGAHGFYYNFITTRTFLFYRSPLTTYLEKAIEKNHKNLIFKQLKQLKEVTKIPGPKFVLCHFVCPHPPYVFLFDKTTNEYVQQVEIFSKKLLISIKSILKNNKSKPIILLQGDHGHPHYGSLQQASDFSPFPSYRIKEAFSILNAWHLPDKNYEKLHNKITPINTFRIIFNQYFGTKLKALEENCFLPINEKSKNLKFAKINHLLKFYEKDELIFKPITKKVAIK